MFNQSRCCSWKTWLWFRWRLSNASSTSIFESNYWVSDVDDTSLHSYSMHRIKLVKPLDYGVLCQQNWSRHFDVCNSLSLLLRGFWISPNLCVSEHGFPFSSTFHFFKPQLSRLLGADKLLCNWTGLSAAGNFCLKLCLEYSTIQFKKGHKTEGIALKNLKRATSVYFSAFIPHSAIASLMKPIGIRRFFPRNRSSSLII